MKKKFGLDWHTWKASSFPKVLAVLVLLFIAAELGIYFEGLPSNPLAAVLSSNGVAVSVTSPISCGSSTCSVSSAGPTLHVVASASSSHPITGWHVYTDNVDVYGVNNVSSIDTNLNVSVGTHTITVRAWDSTGVYGTTILKANIVALPVPTPNVVKVSVTAPVICTGSCSVKSDSSIHIVASASSSSSHPITGWHIYVDSVDKYSSTNVSNIDTTMVLSTGVHAVLIKAWDSTGASGDTTLNVTVSAPAPVPTPTPVSISNIDDASPWKTCGNCGNTGASGATASYYMIQNILAPSIDGSSAQFTIGGNYAYSNAYWYIDHSAPTKLIKGLTYDFWLYVPSNFATAPQAIEFEAEQHVNGLIYNYAWQADYGSKMWRVFNYTAKKWESSGIALTPFAPNTWHHIIAEYHADSSVAYHDALSVDGVRHPVTISHPATPKSVSAQFTNAFQLDLNGQKTPYSVYVDKMNISYTE